MQLIAFVLREYRPSLPMTPEFFLKRVFTIPGRKELRPDSELIVFYENPRDPKNNQALHDACKRISINSRDIRQDGRALRFAIEPAPPKQSAQKFHLGQTPT